MLNHIQDVLLIMLIILQLVVMVYLLITMHIRYKEDKKFWKKQEEISEEFLKQLQEQPITSLDNIIEGDVMVEPETTDKE